jgi:hypothetical protein
VLQSALQRELRSDEFETGEGRTYMYQYTRGWGQIPTTLQPAVGPALSAVEGFGQPVVFRPGERITSTPARKAAILRRAGWKQVNIIVTATNWLGEPMRAARLGAEFKAPGVATVVLSGELVRGGISWRNVWLKPDGWVTFTALIPGQVIPQGTRQYALRDPLKFELIQKSDEMETTATSAAEALVKSGVTGTAEIDFKIKKVGVGLGGEYTQEKGTSKTLTQALSYKISVPSKAFVVNQL